MERIVWVDSAPSAAIPRSAEESRFLIVLTSPHSREQKELPYTQAVEELRMLKRRGWQLRFDEGGVTL